MNLLTTKTKFTAATYAAALAENANRDEQASVLKIGSAEPILIAYPADESVDPVPEPTAAPHVTSVGKRSREQTAAMKAILRAAIAGHPHPLSGGGVGTDLMAAYDRCCDIHTNKYMKRGDAASAKALLRYFFPETHKAKTAKVAPAQAGQLAAHSIPAEMLLGG